MVGLRLVCKVIRKSPGWEKSRAILGQAREGELRCFGSVVGIFNRFDFLFGFFLGKAVIFFQLA